MMRLKGHESSLLDQDGDVHRYAVVGWLLDLPAIF